MFLSRGDRDLGVAFQTHPGRQAFISSGSKEPRSARSRDGYLLGLTGWTNIIFGIDILYDSCRFAPFSLTNKERQRRTREFTRINNIRLNKALSKASLIACFLLRNAIALPLAGKHCMLNRVQPHLLKNSKNLFCRLFLSIKQMACTVTVRTAEPEN